MIKSIHKIHGRKLLSIIFNKVTNFKISYCFLFIFDIFFVCSFVQLFFAIINQKCLKHLCPILSENLSQSLRLTPHRNTHDCYKIEIMATHFFFTLVGEEYSHATRYFVIFHDNRYMFINCVINKKNILEDSSVGTYAKNLLLLMILVELDLKYLDFVYMYLVFIGNVESLRICCQCILKHFSL